MSQKGVALPIILLVLAIIAVGAFLLVARGVIKNPLPELTRPFQKPRVELKTDYKNPLDKNTQYVNPFSTYKNPFNTLK